MSEPSELNTLYPFIYGERRDSVGLDATLLHSIAEKARESREVNERFFAEQAAELLAAANAIAALYRQDGRLFTMGNGGSSCDAAHIAVEFLHPITAGRPALPVINLVADIAMISAIGNDLGFDHVFARQLVAHARARDGLIGISTSGNSSNLIAAFGKAKEMGMTTVGFAGADGGKMKTSGFVDHCLIVPTSSVHRVQETHVAAYHVLWDLVHSLLADHRGSAATSRSAP